MVEHMTESELMSTYVEVFRIQARKVGQSLREPQVRGPAKQRARRRYQEAMRGESWARRALRGIRLHRVSGSYVTLCAKNSATNTTLDIASRTGCWIPSRV